MLDTREVCKAVAGLVDAGEGGVVRIPAYAGWAEWFGVLPAAVQRVVRWASGVDRAVVKRADEEEREGKGEKKTHPGHVGLTPRQADAGARDDMTSSGDDMVVVDKM